MRGCDVVGCDGIHYGRGWCQKHWRRWYTNGTTELDPPKTKVPCSIDDCAGMAIARGWCKTHYHRWSRHGDPLKVLARQEQSNWRGGRTHSGNGYAMVLLDKNDPFFGAMSKDGGYVLEHRIVMARHLGRPLRPDETVHHKNGVRLDNRLENLELWSSSQPSGQRVEDKLAWAREIIALYGEAA